MNLLTENQLKHVSGGTGFPIATALPFEGDRTFTDGFWNGASATGPMLGYAIGTIASLVLYPLDLLGYVDINSHLRKNSATAS